MKSFVLVLDFDGVIADSITKLKLVFKEFLADYHLVVPDKMFDEFNGKTILEIVTFLKLEYKLNSTIAELLGDYKARVTGIYSEIDLLPSCREFLELCRWMNIPVAIASANNGINVNLVLDRFDLRHLFDFIVSSDDVQFGKPHPETYQLIHNYFGECHFLVVDDSIHGLRGALNSGMQVNPILFGSESFDSEHECVKDFTQLGILLSYWIMKEVDLTSVSSFVLERSTFKLPVVDELLLQSHWVNFSAGDEYIFNGVFSIVWGVRLNKDNLRCEFQYFEIDYRTFTFFKNYLGVPLVSLAISGLVLQNSLIIIGLRANWVSQYSNWLELPPSGNLDPSNTPYEQLVIELEEELGVLERQILSRKFLGMYFDVSSKSLDFIYEVSIDTLVQLKASSEYSWVKTYNKSQLQDLVYLEGIVPTSRYILKKAGYIK